MRAVQGHYEESQHHSRRSQRNEVIRKDVGVLRSRRRACYARIFHHQMLRVKTAGVVGIPYFALLFSFY